MVKTKDNELIKPLVMEHLNAINKELEKCNEKLTVQCLHCPTTLSIKGETADSGSITSAIRESEYRGSARSITVWCRVSKSGPEYGSEYRSTTRSIGVRPEYRSAVEISESAPGSRSLDLVSTLFGLDLHESRPLARFSYYSATLLALRYSGTPVLRYSDRTPILRVILRYSEPYSGPLFDTLNRTIILLAQFRYSSTFIALVMDPESEVYALDKLRSLKHKQWQMVGSRSDIYFESNRLGLEHRSMTPECGRSTGVPECRFPLDQSQC